MCFCLKSIFIHHWVHVSSLFVCIFICSNTWQEMCLLGNTEVKALSKLKFLSLPWLNHWNYSKCKLPVCKEEVLLQYYRCDHRLHSFLTRWYRKTMLLLGKQTISQDIRVPGDAYSTPHSSHLLGPPDGWLSSQVEMARLCCSLKSKMQDFSVCFQPPVSNKYI